MTTPAPSAKTWLVIEPHFDGHHFTYLTHIVAGLRERGVRVIVGCGEDAEQGSRIRAGLEREFGAGAVTCVTAPLPPEASGLPGPIRLAVNELRRRRFLRDLFRRAGSHGPVDEVFLPYLDWSLFAVAAAGSPFGGVSFSGITMRQRFHLRARGVRAEPEPMQRAKGALFRRLLRIPTLRRVFTNDPTLAEHFADSGASGAAKVVHIPDPSEVHPTLGRADARARLALPADACVVLLYGYIDARKGARALLDWLRAPATPASVVALVVGQQDADVVRLFASPEARALRDAGRLRDVNGFMAEADEPMYFSAADLVWIAYERFEMMSGVLVKAAQYGRAVIYRDYGLIAHYAQAHGHAPHDTSCAAALASLPGGLLVRDFGTAASTLPDHAWSNAIHLIHD